MPSQEKLLGVYRTAAKELERVIERADPKKPTIYIRRTVLSEIAGITEKLDEQTLGWLSVQIPQEYKLGSVSAIKEAKKQGLGLKQVGFGQIHQEAIQTLIEEAYLDFATGIEGVKRSGREFIKEITKMKINERIIVGEIKGEGLHTIKREVRKLLEKRGFTALIDRGQKRWKINKYAEMLVRTHVIKANAAGTRNRLLENKVTLVEISKHANACPICRPYEGNVYSLTSKDKSHAQAPELPIHPNCKHSYLPHID